MGCLIKVAHISTHMYMSVWVYVCVCVPQRELLSRHLNHKLILLSVLSINIAREIYIRGHTMWKGIFFGNLYEILR